MNMDYDDTKTSRPAYASIENLKQPRRPCFGLRSMIALKRLKLAYF